MHHQIWYYTHWGQEVYLNMLNEYKLFGSVSLWYTKIRECFNEVLYHKASVPKYVALSLCRTSTTTYGKSQYESHNYRDSWGRRCIGDITKIKIWSMYFQWSSGKTTTPYRDSPPEIQFIAQLYRVQIYDGRGRLGSLSLQWGGFQFQCC